MASGRMKKVLRGLAIGAGTLTVFLVLFHFWLMRHAAELVRELVAYESNGKLGMSIGKFNIHYRKLRLDIKDVVIYPIDSLSEHAENRISSAKLTLQVKSVWSLAFSKELDVDSVICVNPVVEIYKHKHHEARKISLPHEVGKIYLSIQRALNSLHVTRLQIDNGSLHIIDRTKSAKPLHINGISLLIDNLKVDSGSLDDQPFLFAENIDFRTGPQDIEWEEGRKHLRCSSLHLNTKANFLSIDSCFMSIDRRDSAAGYARVSFEKLRLVNPDLKGLYTSNVINADTIYCYKPDLDMEIHAKEKASQGDHSFENAVHKLAGDMRLKHLDVEQANVSIRMKKGPVIRSFETQNTSFDFSDIAVRQHEKQPIFIGHINMSIRNYLGYSSDSAYRISFDSITFVNQRVRMANFQLAAFPTTTHQRTTSMNIHQFEMDDISWPELLFEKRIVSSNAVLIQPVIRIESEKTHSSQQKRSVYDVMEHNGQVINIDRFRIVDGSIDYSNKGGLKMELRQLNVFLHSKELLNAPDSDIMASAIRNLSFGHALIKNSKSEIVLHEARFVGPEQLLKVKKFELDNRQSGTKVEARQVVIRDIVSDSNMIKADGVSWEQAVLRLHTKAKGVGQKQNKFILELNEIKGRNTELDITTPNQRVTAHLSEVAIPSFHNEQGFEIGTGALISGRDFKMLGAMRISCVSFQLHGREESVLSRLRIEKFEGRDSLSVYVPRVDFTPHLAELVEGKIEFEDLTIVNPDVRVIKKHSTGHTGETTAQGLPEINIGRLHITNPTVHFDMEKNGRKSKWSMLATRGNEALNFIRIRSVAANKGEALYLKDLEMDIDSLYMQANKSTVIVNKEGNIRAHLSNASFAPATKKDKARWGGLLLSLSTHHLQYHGAGEKPLQLVLHNAELDSMALRSGQVGVESIVKASPGIALKRISGELTTNGNYFRCDNFVYHKKSRNATLDSFYYSPVLSRDSFIAASPYETQYIQASLSGIQIHDIDMNAYLSRGVLDIHKISVHKPLLTIYKDKTVPFNPGAVRPLPVALLRKIPIPVTIDTLALVEGKVYYTERAKKTKLEAPFYLTRLHAVIYPIKNHDIAATDSLRLRAEAYLMDTAWIRVRMRESYTDSLAGFALTAEMRPTHLTFLNPMIEPLVSVKLTSGRLDSLYMHAVGREYLSLGKMHMHYKNLKVSMLKGGVEGRGNFFTGFVTFAANSVIKKNNSKRVGQVYFMRDRYRSIINYWVKMTLSGAATSVGIKHSRKYEKQYRKQLEKLNLPPINF